MIILDTNVISELMRPKPSAQVATWVAQQPGTELFTTSITEAEIFYGIELLGRGKRREGLSATAESLAKTLQEASWSLVVAEKRAGSCEAVAACRWPGV
jgi:predicted nucleic acid-binding protein